MKIPSRVKNILFDMDDVLVLTRRLDREVKEAIFAPLNLGWHQIVPFTHLSMKELVPKMFQALDIKEKPTKYQEAYFKEYNKQLSENIRQNAVPGAAELVKKLSQENYRLALVTSSTLSQALIVSEGLGLNNSFEIFVTANDIMHSKPHPEPYQKAIEKLKAEPEECLVFEDLPTGVASAKAASNSIFVVAITTTNPRENLKQADFVIDSFSQIEIPVN